MTYPAYSRAERIADGAVHVLGICLGIAGVAVFFTVGTVTVAGPARTAIIVYSVALVAMLSASGAYHMAAHTRARPLLRRLDHAAIYVKIAGTFTPLSVVLGTAFGYVVLGVVWLLALAGAAAKLMTAPGRMTTGWLPYMALGWVGIALFIPLAAILPIRSLALLLAGGLTYSAGVLFYCWDSLKFANAIWHIFTLAASACFYFGIATAVAAAG